MQKIKCKDQVVVIAGKDKGKTGTVLKVITLPNAKKVMVEGINMVKKHVRANPSAGKEGGIISQEAAIDISNVAILNPNTGKADKVSFKVLENENRKVRVFSSTGEVVDV
jgi:large subunit ribosomal protein L24